MQASGFDVGGRGYEPRNAVPEAAKGRFFLRASRRSMAVVTPWFGPSENDLDFSPSEL